MKDRNRLSAAGKVKSQKGASMAIALLYFLICAMVGSVVLAAASANVSHVKAEKRNEANYLAVMSAAELLKAQLKACAGEWESDIQEADEVADDMTRMGMKEEMLDLLTFSADGKAVKQGLLHDFYQAYLSCLLEDRLEVSGGQVQSSQLTFELAESGMPAVTVNLTVTPDYAVLNSRNSQQLHVTAEADFFITDDASGQYLMHLTMGGLVHYTLDEEETMELLPETGETKTAYQYTSKVIFTPEEPYLSGGRQTGGAADEP